MAKPSGTPIEKYLDYCDQVFRTEPEYFGNQPDHELKLPGVSGISYRNSPEKGVFVSLTYGLSRYAHPAWGLGNRPEILLAVNSDDRSWAMVTGYLAQQKRGKLAFQIGETIDFGTSISKQSKMDAFLVAPPLILGERRLDKIDVGLPYNIVIVGIFPIYASEIALVEAWGWEKFWKHPGFDGWNLNRAPIVPDMEEKTAAMGRERRVPPMGGCYVSNKIVNDGLPVGYMMREEPDNASDSGWRFSSGTETQAYVDDPKNGTWIDVNTVAQFDAAIIPYTMLPVGTDLMRVQGTGEFRDFGT